jgi:hypothetical protein
VAGGRIYDFSSRLWLSLAYGRHLFLKNGESIVLVLRH